MTTQATFTEDDYAPPLIPIHTMHAFNNGSGQAGKITVCTTATDDGAPLITIERAGLEFTPREARALAEVLVNIADGI